MAKHSWHFVGTHIGGGSDVPLVAAVCSVCGEVRAARALLATHKGYERIDLTGECADAPSRSVKFG